MTMFRMVTFWLVGVILCTLLANVLATGSITRPASRMTAPTAGAPTVSTLPVSSPLPAP
ncbi:hypothetical protein [Goodfellowiella coeruleoviolacea]|uniref:Uncharacterized protein n=1 Tax=Goodfellowiella coeruleoviolacea TaxID=334858 RepID=A0AAE3GN74_9PSEU|nr:hypothetical protein [Goodfellowiella coeruleoviolacea]MCP2169093.1 hypothetical protein [Goodfellowiella coeruleoviolacea]